MEEKFASAWAENRETAAALGVRIRPVEEGQALSAAKRCLASRRLSDGFSQLQALGRLDLSLEALAIHRRFTGLFSDDEANEALSRLLEAGYAFP